MAFDQWAGRVREFLDSEHELTGEDAEASTAIVSAVRELNLALVPVQCWRAMLMLATVTARRVR